MYPIEGINIIIKSNAVFNNEKSDECSFSGTVLKFGIINNK
jgi:hypothetical protein